MKFLMRNPITRLIFLIITLSLISGAYRYWGKPVYAKAGNIVRCSISCTGEEANFGSQCASITPDGRYVVFASYASNLVPNDTNNSWDIFRKDMYTGEVIICSTTADGQQSTGHSFRPTISADGRYVAFESVAKNLIPGSTDNHTDVFRKDLITGALEGCTYVSSYADRYASTPCISADGRYVVFVSNCPDLVPGDSNLDPSKGYYGEGYDIFRKDFLTGEIECCSKSFSGEIGNSISLNESHIIPYISPDARYIAFRSWSSNLVPGDTNGTWDVFLKDMVTGEIRRCSVTSSGVEANGASYSPTVSSDGRYVAFCTEATNFIMDDINGTQFDVYRKDLLTGDLSLCSVTQNGEQGNAESGNRTSISADGRFVSFMSIASNLVPGDTNDKFDVFCKDMLTRKITCCSCNASGVIGNNESSYNVLSADGKTIIFQSNASNLVPNDTNETSDIFLKDIDFGVYATSIELSTIGSTQYSDRITLVARLLDENDLPLKDKPVLLRFGGIASTAYTNSFGIAAMEMQAILPAGEYAVSATFDGDEGYLSSSDESVIIIAPEELSIAYSGDYLKPTGSSVRLSARVSEEADESPGDITKAGEVCFAIYDPQRILVYQESAAVGTDGKAETIIASLPANVYTVKASLTANSYYKAQSSTIESQLVVYNPQGGSTCGAGCYWVNCVKKSFGFDIKYSSCSRFFPEGYLCFNDWVSLLRPIKIEATEFAWLVIPSNKEIAYVAGACEYNGSNGYTFYLTIEDKSCLWPIDTFHITVKNSSCYTVYDSEGTVTLGGVLIR